MTESMQQLAVRVVIHSLGRNCVSLSETAAELGISISAEDAQQICDELSQVLGPNDVLLY